MEKKTVKNKNNDDLKFTPLDINPPFNMSNYKLNSITPHNALEGISINSDCNNIYIGFPPLALNSSTNMTSPYMGTENIGNNNIDNPYMTNSSLFNSKFNSGNTTGYYPAMPYPDNIPSIDTSNTTPIISSNENTINNEFPSEPSSNDLFSYNTTDFRNISYYLPLINPLDILRNFNLSLYDDSRDSASNKEIDEIFESIKTNNSHIFSTLKAYRIPLPIASLIIKKIIKITLEHK